MNFCNSATAPRGVPQILSFVTAKKHVQVLMKVNIPEPDQLRSGLLPSRVYIMLALSLSLWS